jgi:hypothetical protein
MTDQEKADVQMLLDALPRCWPGNGGRCNEIAVRSHPGPVIGERTMRCAAHPGEEENEFDETASPTRWAAVIERFVAQGFRSSR